MTLRAFSAALALLALVGSLIAGKREPPTVVLEPIYAEPVVERLMMLGETLGPWDRYCTVRRIWSVGRTGYADFRCRFPASPEPLTEAEAP